MLVQCVERFVLFWCISYRDAIAAGRGGIDWIDDGDFDTFNSALVILRRAGLHLMQLSPGNSKSPKYR